MAMYSKPKTMGSDRGAKMKADSVQKKKQYVSNVKNKRSTMTLAEQKSAGYKSSNDLSAGRVTQRKKDQGARTATKRAFGTTVFNATKTAAKKKKER